MAIPILLIPGLNATAEVFAHQIPALWQFGPVTVADHRRGETVSEIALNILRDAPPSFALVGFSMGGYIAFEVLRQARGRVRSLALLDTSARPDTDEQAQRRRDAIALAERGKLPQLVLASLANAVHPESLDNADLQTLRIRMSAEAGPEAYIRQQRANLARQDSRDLLPTIDVPTLIVVGESDAITVPDASREMAAAIRGSTLVIVPSAGHMALVEQPDIVTAAMVEWLRTSSLSP
jgi:pimeloyl-ACP methyl ester carboxylesterase